MQLSKQVARQDEAVVDAIKRIAGLGVLIRLLTTQALLELQVMNDGSCRRLYQQTIRQTAISGHLTGPYGNLCQISVASRKSIWNGNCSLQHGGR